MRTFIALLALVYGASLMATERPTFTLERKDSGVEIRQYRPYLVAQTVVEGPMEAAGNEGFRRLAGYIFGGNGSGQKIAMTAPVAMAPLPSEVRATAGGFLVQFMMPSRFTLASLPTPRDGRVTFAQVPARRVAALAYQGNWSEARYQAHLDKLRAYLAAQGLRATGTPVWARYDPPFMPTFLRTNEILVEVAP